jgi:hypothetical protein
MVTRLEAYENNVGNRGSKSITCLNLPASQKAVIVKEQRVNGSYANILGLRCILMGIERNYQIKTLSKRDIQYRGYTSAINNIGNPHLMESRALNP